MLTKWALALSVVGERCLTSISGISKAMWRFSEGTSEGSKDKGASDCIDWLQYLSSLVRRSYYERTFAKSVRTSQASGSPGA
jgi:hypothetical protein